MLASLGCGDPLVAGDEALGTFFVLSGPLDADLVLDSDATRGGIAWAHVVDGTLGGQVVDVPLEPRFLSYALTVEGPPDPVDASSSGPAPPDLDVAGVSILIGLPLLYTDPRAAAELDVDAGWLLDWATGQRDTLDGAVEGDGVEVMATTTDHLVMGLSLPPGAERLSEVADWPSGGDACRLDGLIDGLTVYRSDGLLCGGWRALAAAGERTEFQGVAMGTPP